MSFSIGVSNNSGGGTVLEVKNYSLEADTHLTETELAKMICKFLQTNASTSDLGFYIVEGDSDTTSIRFAREGG